MTPTENKEIVRRRWYDELWNTWNVQVADDLFAADYHLHLSGVPVPVDRATAKQIVQMFSVAFPDLHHTVDELIGEGNTVAARWTVRGTHRGDFQGLAPTGKQVSVSGTTVHHMSDGRIVETWLTLDNLELLQQLGAAPLPARA